MEMNDQPLNIDPKLENEKVVSEVGTIVFN